MNALFEKGDNIAVICPATQAEAGLFDNFIAHYSDYNFMISPLSYDPRDNIDKERAQEIENLFADKNIAGIICGRGGYGTIRKLSLINYDIIKNNPKPFFGFSDITALQMAMYKHAGLKSYTGLIMKTKETKNNLMLSSFEKTICHMPQIFENITMHGATSLQGQIIAGNLATIASLVGTPYLPDFAGKILVIEDIDECPYRIDRMLYQMYHAGVFNKVKALCFGTFENCINPTYPNGKTAWSYINDFTKLLNCPIIYGLPYGHQEQRIVIQLDARCEISNGKMTIY